MRHAAGRGEVRESAPCEIIKTPGEVMLSSKLLKEKIGDLLTIDVGGATTDIHSVTEGTEKYSNILISPEPYAKRTVEGDLGVWVNRNNILSMLEHEEISKLLEVDPEEVIKLIANMKAIPQTAKEKKLVEILTEKAVSLAIQRHVGKTRDLYGPTGKSTIAEGKDLSGIMHLIGTGGALSRLENNRLILSKIASEKKANEMLPDSDVNILIDNCYIMASLGVLSKEYPEAALRLLFGSLGISNKSYSKET